MDETELEQLIQALGPEGVQAMMDAMLAQGRIGAAQGEIGQGQQLMATPSAEGRNVGGTYVAASPFEHAATAMARILGQKQMQTGKAQQEAQFGKIGEGVNRYLRGVTLAGKPQLGPEMPPGYGPGF